MRPFYSALYSLALMGGVLAKEYRKRPAPIRRRWLREKLGHVPPEVYAKAQNPLWVHAVSVGEVIAAVPFIKEFKAQMPEVPVVVSTITDTGQDVARQRLGGLAEAIYLPMDLGFALDRAIKALRPRALVIMETEIWPNLIDRMKAHDVPVVMLNGRISEKSYHGYRKLKFLMGGLLRQFDALCMQDEVYAERIRGLGAPGDRVHVPGNFKFDIKMDAAPIPWASGITGPVIVAGSTHEPEEALIADVYKRLLDRHPSLNLIVAPRHPHRFEHVEKVLLGRGLKVIRRSTAHDGQTITGSAVLLDTVGELTNVYALCDIAVIGGSFIPHGGQNPLEPACFAKPVVTGPNMANFPFVEDFYRQEAAVRATEASLEAELDALLSNASKREIMGNRGKAILDKNRGAVEKSIRIVRGLFKNI